MKIFKVDCDRFSEHKAFYFNENKQLLPFSEKLFCANECLEFPTLPQNIDKMIILAEELACELKFVRIDFYNVNGKISL